MCREQLPVWQRFYEAHQNDNFEILAIAMDAQGAEVARRFTEAAGVRFPTAVDRAQGLWELYGFNVVPNGFFVDEKGILRYVNVGGFEVRNAEHAKAIEDLLAAASGPTTLASAETPAFGTVEDALREAEEALARDPQNLDLQLTLAERRVASGQREQARQDFEAVLKQNPLSARALLGLATVYLDQGERDKALAALKQAWAIQPDNWIIRKQIWAVEHPEQFYPAINPEWQRERIQQEKAEKSP
jgi:tetratricopeptide (TPR) repeat protein